MQWTNFDPFSLPAAVRTIHVTLNPRGQFYLNSGAMNKLAEPVAVRLMFDKEAGLIGIAAAPLNSKASFELHAKYGVDAPGRVFRATTFCKHLGILPDRTILFQNPKVENGILTLNTRTTIDAPKRAISITRLMEKNRLGPTG